MSRSTSLCVPKISTYSQISGIPKYNAAVAVKILSVADDFDHKTCANSNDSVRQTNKCSKPDFLSYNLVYLTRYLCPHFDFNENLKSSRT
ncbi:hypothetical protein L596_019303 [Steinernema carpocapsae]|uniref:Uncharacterized protein n=1 Tax=Steinernema carpocapsae TaxID=34508 RepID=A0A4V6A0I7_STECR|nr:hypothetical protein L596_019303 [Steinernema carpocapsae]